MSKKSNFRKVSRYVRIDKTSWTYIISIVLTPTSCLDSTTSKPNCQDIDKAPDLILLYLYVFSSGDIIIKKGNNKNTVCTT